MAERNRPAPAAAIAWAFAVSTAASIGLAVVYASGGQPQLEGALLFLSLGGLSIGLITWAKRLMPQGPHVEARHVTLGEPVEQQETEEAFAAGMEQVPRRRFLGRLLFGALAALGLTSLFPIRSLGQRPGSALYRTSWRGGRRAVTPDGAAVRAADLVDNSVLTVFPERHTDAADSQVVLIKTAAGTFRPASGRETWAPEGIVGFSKICTHAGCPVGLYQAETQELFCPCHQSVFSVPDGAVPTEGPATRPLPQLPLAIDADGFVVAQADFDEPVGPEFWRFGKRP